MEEYKRGQAAEQAKGAAAYEDFLKGAAAACECQDVALLKARRTLTPTPKKQPGA